MKTFVERSQTRSVERVVNGVAPLKVTFGELSATASPGPASPPASGSTRHRSRQKTNSIRPPASPKASAASVQSGNSSVRIPRQHSFCSSVPSSKRRRPSAKTNVPPVFQLRPPPPPPLPPESRSLPPVSSLPPPVGPPKVMAIPHQTQQPLVSSPVSSTIPLPSPQTGLGGGRVSTLPPPFFWRAGTASCSSSPRASPKVAPPPPASSLNSGHINSGSCLSSLQIPVPPPPSSLPPPPLSEQRAKPPPPPPSVREALSVGVGGVVNLLSPQSAPPPPPPPEVPDLRVPLGDSVLNASLKGGPPPLSPFEKGQGSSPCIQQRRSIKRRSKCKSGNPQFICGPCEKSFRNEAKLQKHVEVEHVPCSQPGCTYSGPPHALQMHRMQHLKNKKGESLIDNPEETAAWREARRRNFPGLKKHVSEDSRICAPPPSKSVLERILRNSLASATGRRLLHPTCFQSAFAPEVGAALPRPPKKIGGANNPLPLSPYYTEGLALAPSTFALPSPSPVLIRPPLRYLLLASDIQDFERKLLAVLRFIVEDGILEAAETAGQQDCEAKPLVQVLPLQSLASSAST